MFIIPIMIYVQTDIFVSKGWLKKMGLPKEGNNILIKKLKAKKIILRIKDSKLLT